MREGWGGCRESIALARCLRRRAKAGAGNSLFQTEPILSPTLFAGGEPSHRAEPRFFVCGKRKKRRAALFLRDSFKGIRIPMRSRKA
ncbi:MAG: hypothetical protein DBY39_03820 [Clostridiales bacterium]|nr:MAG: hypothetical protein DBY39_03820 [Clostridiales bacterium]